MAGQDKTASKTMRIDIPPYMPPGDRNRPGIANPSRPMRPTVSATPSRKTGAFSPVRKTDLFPIEDADFKELFRQVYDAAFITRLKGRIVDANLRATQSFAYTRNELRQKSIVEIVSGLDEAVLQTICNNLERDQFTLLQARCLRKDGTPFPAEIATSRLRLTSRDCLCFFIRDITTRREAEDALKKARDDLQAEVAERERINLDLCAEIGERKRVEEALQSAIIKLQEHDKAKSQFVSNVSHELKTPLTSINYAAGNMLKGIAGQIPETATPYLDMIRVDCQRLRRTVDDILDMSRIEANALNLSKVKVHFQRFVEKTVESLRIQVEAANLSLYVNVKTGNSFVDCDPQKMERVIFNLLKNAIKYNIPGGSVGVELKADTTPHGNVTVDITDTGVGIAAEHLAHVTDRFFRVGEHVSGAGLGLHICKELIDRHGGTIDIKSPPPAKNRGTQVSFRVPLAPPPALMLICSDEHLRLSLFRALDQSGYRVMSGKTAANAFEVAGELKPDLVVVDWIKEGMEGGVSIATIKANQAWANTSILTMTGEEASGAKREILDGLGIPYIVHPWQPAELLSCLDEVLTGKSSRDN